MIALREVSLRFLVLCAACAAFSRATSADVLVVDARGGGDFTAIQPAVDAANDGDTLLVRDGDYAGFVVDDKALTVVRDAGAAGAIVGSIGVRNLSASKDVVLQNLKAAPLPAHATLTASSGRALWCTNDAGSVRVQDCELTGANLPPAGCDDEEPPNAGAFVQSSLDVVFVRCTLTGGRGWGVPGCFCGAADQGAPGLSSSASLVALYGCTLKGGPGGRGMECGGKGGNGAFVSGSLGLYASQSTFTGGAGGTQGPPDPTFFCIPLNGGFGGGGLVVQNPAAAQSLDNTFTAGPAGSGDEFNCGYGFTYQGGATEGNVFHFVGEGRSIQFDSPVREGTPLSVTISGVAGDRVRLRLASKTEFQTVPSFRGVLLTKHLEQGLIVGTLPASGTLTVSVPNPMLPSGVLEKQKHLQAAILGAQGDYVGGFGTLVVLDAGL